MNENLLNNIEIIDSEENDWFFSVKQENGERETFVILGSRSSKWIELWGDIDDYHCLYWLCSSADRPTLGWGTLYGI